MTTVEAQRRRVEVRPVRCGIYTRKSTDEGLDSEFSTLDAQREAAEAYIASQREDGWVVLADRYDDGGFSGGTLERPALQRLLADVEAGKVDCIVVHRIDRFSRSLFDFSKLAELLEQHGVALVSVTQRLDTSTSMGRLTLNMLLSFAQFERELIGERIRDKVAATKRKGKYCGGMPVLGYDVDRERKRLVVNPDEAELVRHVFQRFIEMSSTTRLAKELNAQGHRTKSWTTKEGALHAGRSWNKAHLYRLLNNHIYLGLVTHKGQHYPGEHEAIIEQELWDQVHAILEVNHRARAGETRAKSEALLRGIIRCAHCDCAMGPHFTRRRGKQYRYYLCVRTSKEGYDSCPVRSLSAGEIERVVVDQLRRVMRSPEILAQTYREAQALAEGQDVPDFTEGDVVDAISTLDPIWDHLFPDEQARIVQSLVKQVDVHPDRAEVRIRAEGLA
ncbi:MAG: recombinase family protein, partial [Armatimonadetes bacterium]|nr:recombinase family protein [Armatimonadota bacterium]